MAGFAKQLQLVVFLVNLFGRTGRVYPIDYTPEVTVGALDDVPAPVLAKVPGLPGAQPFEAVGEVPVAAAEVVLEVMPAALSLEAAVEVAVAPGAGDPEAASAALPAAVEVPPADLPVGGALPRWLCRRLRVSDVGCSFLGGSCSMGMDCLFRAIPKGLLRWDLLIQRPARAN